MRLFAIQKTEVKNASDVVISELYKFELREDDGITVISKLKSELTGDDVLLTNQEKIDLVKSRFTDRYTTSTVTQLNYEITL